MALVHSVLVAAMAALALHSASAVNGPECFDIDGMFSDAQFKNKAVYTAAPIAGRGSNELGRGSNVLGRGSNE